MTKYVINSGGLRNNIPSAKKFVAEIVKDLGNEPNILFCFFAQPREDWEEVFPIYAKGFQDWLPDNIQPKFELAFPDKLENQIKTNDAIYIHGGDDHLLKYWFSHFAIPDIWKNKVVATNSASTNILAKSFWTCDWRQCFNGLGILPIKVIPHYKSAFGKNDPRGPIDWDKAHDELKAFGENKLPIYALKEGEYEVFTFD
jgi:peptidase E